MTARSKPGPARGDLAALTARAVERLGAADFYERLLDLLASAAAHDLAALVRYSRRGPPDLILPRVTLTPTLLAYYHHFYAYDPFLTHWQGGGETGVFRLRGMDARIGRSRYAREFLTAMAIYDEIAVILPPLGDAAPTLILDRARGSFTQAEMQRVQRLFPLLAALHLKHLGLIVAQGAAVAAEAGASALGEDRPMRLIDRTGQEVYATAAWTAAIAEPAVAEAAAIAAGRGPCALVLPGRRLLRRVRLPLDFGPAPSGYCDEIGQDAPLGEGGPAARIPAALAQQLTEREQEVVLLTLQGHPVIEIARKLGLSRGTVKNYRLSIYRKLDITTERELFSEYMRAILSPPG
jgi:DNA-binding CsgD family transcriptional regulator